MADPVREGPERGTIYHVTTVSADAGTTESGHALMNATNPGEPGRPLFECTDCFKSYTQAQLLTRHYREKHQPCLKCLVSRLRLQMDSESFFRIQKTPQEEA